MRDVTPDLFFASIAEREVQYNARASVADFDACVRRYAESAARVRTRRPAVLNLRYGMGQDERLDLFLPAAAQASAPLFVFIHGGYWRSQRKEDAPVMAEAFNAAGAAVATLEYAAARSHAARGGARGPLRRGLAVPQRRRLWRGSRAHLRQRQLGRRPSGGHAGRAGLAGALRRAGRRDQGTLA